MIQTLEYNTRNNISFLSLKLYLIYLIAPTDFTNDQNTILRSFSAKFTHQKSKHIQK